MRPFPLPLPPGETHGLVLNQNKQESGFPWIADPPPPLVLEGGFSREKAVGQRENLLDLGLANMGQVGKCSDPYFPAIGQADMWTSRHI